MKFLCECGHVIRDQTDYLPYKGWVMRDKLDEAFYDAATQSIADFLNACVQGTRDEWLTEQFGSEYPRESDEAVIYDLMSTAEIRYSLHIYQCEACGRLWLTDRHNPSRMLSFVPEDGRRDVLDAGPSESERHG